MLLLYTQNVRRKDEMRRSRKWVAVLVQHGLALLFHVLLELVLVEDHVDDLLLGRVSHFLFFLLGKRNKLSRLQCFHFKFTSI